ncbi:hypothetical protein ACFL59_15460 [Planctomycetota bacterium]
MPLLAACSDAPEAAAAPQKEAVAWELRPGDLALDYVAGDRFDTLLIEVDYVQGAAYSYESLETFTAVLAQRLRKPGGIELDIASDPIPAEGLPRIYRDVDIRELEFSHRQSWSGDKQNRNRAVLWIVYLDGESRHDTEEAQALGASLGGSQIAVFSETLDRLTTAEYRDAAEARVLLHETGHVLGLVNNGVPMIADHEDLGHQFHDGYQLCIMHYRVELRDGHWTPNGTPLDFCYPCRVDLHAVDGPDPGPRLEGAPPGVDRIP